MLFIAHRINTIEELDKLPSKYGVELDLRDDLNGRIYIQHNPFEPGEDFEEYLKHYHHGLMILNIKSERIEHKVLGLIEKYAIKDYFFLDSSFPMIALLSQMGEKKIALRLSEFEGMDTLKRMAGKVDWVWVDCFTKIPVTQEDMLQLKAWGYKTCFVSPELQGRSEDVQKYVQILNENKIVFDAVCSKIYEMDNWENAFS